LVPTDRLYTEEHLWLKEEGDRLRIGLTEYGQGELGDVVYLDPPAVGEKITVKTAMASIESTKAVSDLLAPVTGEVVEVNDELQFNPELINQDPYGKGWIILVEPVRSWKDAKLLTAKEYAGLIGE